LPLLLSFGVVEDVPALGVDEDEEELVSLDVVPDDVAPLDGVPLAELDDDGDELGVDELDDMEPLEDGGVVVDDDDDVDGDGVTVGGDVEFVVELSRLQPATPSTSPVQSNVTSAPFIAVSR
jgi:hypothetical protein